MRSNVFFAFACSLFALLGQAQGDAQVPAPTLPEFTPIDGIIAVIGQGIVLESELEAQAFAMRAQMAQMGKSAQELTATQRCNLIEDLLFQKLLVHQARLDSIEVTPAEVMDEIERQTGLLHPNVWHRRGL